MSNKNSGLGRGLDLLLGFDAADEPENTVRLDINALEPNRAQPRKNFDPEALSALAESISKYGIITPIAVRRIDDGRYSIIAGERRYRAARIAGLKEVPVNILEVDANTSLELAMVENLQREDLNPIEEAEGFKTLIEACDLTQEEAAARVGLSRPAVANLLRLLDLPDEIKKLVIAGKLSSGHARTLLPLDYESQLFAAEKILREELSVRKTEALVKSMLKPVPEPSDEPETVDYAAELGRSLSESLGRGVKVMSTGKNRGKVVLEYYDLDDLDALIALLKR
ncbi:MAG: ParB/RepB/Spo0J family partition protein [Clostridia bacterium]|nr:ParB/RepB/Spo0J family partition protein [Clostridia bacterium]